MTTLRKIRDQLYKRFIRTHQLSANINSWFNLLSEVQSERKSKHFYDLINFDELRVSFYGHRKYYSKKPELFIQLFIGLCNGILRLSSVRHGGIVDSYVSQTKILLMLDKGYSLVLDVVDLREYSEHKDLLVQAQEAYFKVWEELKRKHDIMVKYLTSV